MAFQVFLRLPRESSAHQKSVDLTDGRGRYEKKANSVCFGPMVSRNIHHGLYCLQQLGSGWTVNPSPEEKHTIACTQRLLWTYDFAQYSPWVVLFAAARVWLDARGESMTRRKNIIACTAAGPRTRGRYGRGQLFMRVLTFLCKSLVLCPAFLCSHDLMSPPNPRRKAGSVEGSPTIPSRRTIPSPSLASSNSRPRSHSVEDVTREGGGIASGGSRLPLPISTKKEVAVRAVDSSFAGGTAFDSTGAAATRKKCRQGDECSGVISEGRGGHHDCAAIGNHRTEGAGGGGRGGGPRGSTGEDGLRKVERISTLERTVGGGDIFLFRCRGLLSALQRWVSRSEWDHVGVVSPCYLLTCANCISRNQGPSNTLSPTRLRDFS